MRVGGVDAGAGAPARPGDDAKLRGAARQLTGLFAQQLFKAMRDTVPQDEGVVSGGSGEEMFTGMLDEHLAGADAGASAPGGGATGAAGAAFTRGLAEAVYRKLRAHSGVAATGVAVTGVAATGAADTHSGGTVTPPAAAASLSSTPSGTRPIALPGHTPPALPLSAPAGPR